MLRFILVGLVWLVCVGGVAFYMYSRDADRDSATVRSAPESATKNVDLEMTLTFEPEADPFALGIAKEEDPHTLPLVSVRINNKPVAELHEALPPGTPWFKQNIEGVAVGINKESRVGRLSQQDLLNIADVRPEILIAAAIIFNHHDLTPESFEMLREGARHAKMVGGGRRYYGH